MKKRRQSSLPAQLVQARAWPPEQELVQQALCGREQQVRLPLQERVCGLQQELRQQLL